MTRLSTIQDPKKQPVISLVAGHSPKFQEIPNHRSGGWLHYGMSQVGFMMGPGTEEQHRKGF